MELAALEEYLRWQADIIVCSRPKPLDDGPYSHHPRLCELPRTVREAIATAVELRNSNGYNITPIDIQAGIRDTVWPARLELIPGNRDRADVLLDVGHNPAGAWALRAAVSHLDRGQPLTLVFGCLKDKPAAELAQILAETSDD